MLKINSRKLPEVDFIDLGCGVGRSTEFCAKHFKKKMGLGIDLDKKRLLELEKKGFFSCNANFLDVNINPKSVSFVSMMDFLEHLPDYKMVENTLEKAASVAQDFLFIRHPSFEHIEYLAQLGLKITWTDWSGHPSKIRLAEFCQMFDRLGLNLYTINYRMPITSSMDKNIVPSNANINTQYYDPDIHEAKENIIFPQPLWAQVDIFIPLRPYTHKEWKKVTQNK